MRKPMMTTCTALLLALCSTAYGSSGDSCGSQCSRDYGQPEYRSQKDRKAQSKAEAQYLSEEAYRNWWVGLTNEERLDQLDRGAGKTSLHQRAIKGSKETTQYVMYLMFRRYGLEYDWQGRYAQSVTEKSHEGWGATGNWNGGSNRSGGGSSTNDYK